MFRPWLPTCMTQPMITSSISAGSSWLRSTSCFSTSPARSAGCHPDSFPLRLPPAVRTASTMTAVAMGCSSGSLDRTVKCGRGWLAAATRGLNGPHATVSGEGHDAGDHQSTSSMRRWTGRRSSIASSPRSTPTQSRWPCAPSSRTAATPSGPTGTTRTTWRARPPTSRRPGVGAGDRVVLMMRNVPEFHFIDLGIAALGATSISIYNSSSPEQIAYLTRPLPGEARHRRGRRLRGAVPRRARRAPGARDDRQPVARRRHGTAVPRRLRGPRRGGRGLHPGHARHGHLHVGHHRTAQGRDAVAPQRRVDRGGLPADARRRAGRASGRCRTSRWRTSRSGCRRTTSR